LSIKKYFLNLNHHTNGSENEHSGKEVAQVWQGRNKNNPEKTPGNESLQMLVFGHCYLAKKKDDKT